MHTWDHHAFSYASAQQARPSNLQVLPTARGSRQGLITSFTEDLWVEMAKGTGKALRLNPGHHLDLRTPALLQTLPASRSDANTPLRRTKTRHVTMHRCTPTRLLTKQC